MDSLPTPPNEDHFRSSMGGPKRQHSHPKAVKIVHRTSKRANTHGHHPASPASEIVHHLPHHLSSHPGTTDGRHKRVWKACERCRMKKTKCDGEFPCKRCKDDGLVCTAGTRKKMEYKQLPRGYAEVLENTQFALIATVHKLYAMVRNQQTWDLGEPELNERGQPVIHNIAAKLGCIRPHSDVDLPAHSVFPEDEAGLAELARQLEEQQQREAMGNSNSGGGLVQSRNANNSRHKPNLIETDSNCNRTDRASSSELDHSDFEDYRKTAFGGGRRSALNMSPQSLSYSDFDLASTATPLSESFTSQPTLSLSSQQQQQQQQRQQAATVAAFQQAAAAAWIGGVGQGGSGSRPTSSPLDFGSQQQQQQQQSQQQQAYMPNGSFLDLDLLNQGLLESSFGTIKPHVLSCPNPEVMLGMGDPMIYSGYDADRLI